MKTEEVRFLSSYGMVGIVVTSPRIYLRFVDDKYSIYGSEGAKIALQEYLLSLSDKFAQCKVGRVEQVDKNMFMSKLVKIA